jgi:hypothetical protein
VPRPEIDDGPGRPPIIGYFDRHDDSARRSPSSSPRWSAHSPSFSAVLPVPFGRI